MRNNRGLRLKRHRHLQGRAFDELAMLHVEAAQAHPIVAAVSLEDSFHFVSAHYFTRPISNVFLLAVALRLSKRGYAATSPAIIQ